MSPPTLYIYPLCPFCRSVLTFSKHLNFKLNIKEINIGRKEHLTEEYGKINPQHTVPTLVDNGFYLWESRAILAYLANNHAPENPIYPKDPKERAIVDRMLYFDIGTLYKAEGEYLHPQMYKGQPADPEKEEALKKILDLLEGFLNMTAYAAGDHMTLADFSIIASLSLLEAADYSFADFPKITAWMHKLKSEITSYKEVNEVSLQQLKEFIKSKK